MPEAMEKVIEKVDAIARNWEDFKKENDKQLKEIKEKGSVDPLLKEKVEKMNAGFDQMLAEKKAMLKEIEELKAALNRQVSTMQKEIDHEALERKKAFLKFLRQGDARMAQEEMKKLMVSDDTDGGYLVDPQSESEMIRNLGNINALRGMANVRTISKGDALTRRRRMAGVTATWANETSSNPSAQNPTLGKLRIEAHEMRVLIDETSQILEDAAIDMEAWISDEAGEAFANKEGDAFVNGDGALKPRGLLTYTSGTSDGQVEQVNSGSAATIADADGQANGLISMVYKLKAAYAKNGMFLLNRLTTGSVRKLKDSQKQYIWSPGIGSEPATILGYKYEEDDNMPVEGAGNLVVAFADFKKFYKILDRLGMSVTRDPFSAKPDVEFLFRRRVGGGVEIFEAGKILKCSA